MEDIIDIIVTETTNTIEITAQPNDEIIDVNIIDNREDIVLNVTPTVVEININSLTSNFGVAWGDITGTLSDQTDLNTVLTAKANLVDGKVPSSELPSYVDDVVEVATFSALPATGEVGKIYVILDTNKIYRWSGSTYIEIADSTAVWGAITGTLSSQTDLQTALDLKANDNIVVKLLGDQTIEGIKTFEEAPLMDIGVGFKNGNGVYNYLKSINTGWEMPVNGQNHNLIFSTSTNYVYTFPNASGTIALTSDLGAYLPLAGGTMTGAIVGTTSTFAMSGSGIGLGVTLSGASGDGIKITHSAGRAFNIQSSGGGFGILINNETASTSAPFTIQKQGLAVITLTDAGAGSFASSLTASSFIKSGGTSSQFLKADGSVDSTSYQPILTNPVTGTGTSGIVAKFSGTSAITDSIIYDNGTRVSIGANVTTTNTFTSVSSTTSSYAVVAQASSAANGIWSNVLGTGEIFRGQTAGGSYFIINNGGNAFLNGNLNVGDFASTSYKLNVVGTANITGALSGTSATFSSTIFGNAPLNNTVITTSDSTNITNGFNLLGSSSYWGIRTATSGNFNLDVYGAGSTRNALSISQSTGAATFTGDTTFNASVAIGTTPTNRLFQVYGNTSTTTPIVKFENAGTGDAVSEYRVTGSSWYVGIDNSDSDKFKIGTELLGAGDKFTIQSDGNVGIGTTAPGYPLHIVTPTSTDANNTNTGSTANLYNYFVRQKGASNGISGIQYMLQTFSDAGANGMEIYTQGASSTLVFGTASTERMRITSAGAIQMKTAAPFSFFYSTQNVAILATSDNQLRIQTLLSGSGQLNVESLGTGLLYSSSGTLTSTNPSDSRLKTDIKSIEYGLKDILKLRAVSYNWKEDKINQGIQFGFIAQEVQEVMPDAIKEFGDETKFLGLEKDAIYATLVNAIKELNKKIETLENK